MSEPGQIVVFNLLSKRFKELLALCALSWEYINIVFYQNRMELYTRPDELKPSVANKKDKSKVQPSTIMVKYYKDRMETFEFSGTKPVGIRISPNCLNVATEAKCVCVFTLLKKEGKLLLSVAQEGSRAGRLLTVEELVNNQPIVNYVAKHYANMEPSLKVSVDFLKFFQKSFKKSANKILEVKIYHDGIIHLVGWEVNGEFSIFDVKCNDIADEVGQLDPMRSHIKKKVSIQDCRWVSCLSSLNEGGIIKLYCSPDPQTPSIFETDVGNQGVFVGTFSQIL